MYYNFCYNTTVEGLPCSQAQGSATLYDRVVTVKGVGSAGEALGQWAGPRQGGGRLPPS